MLVYDLRTNFTLKENPLRSEDLDEFVACFHAENRHERSESERFRGFTYAEIAARDKANLDLIWLRDNLLDDAADLREPSILAGEIVEDLEVALVEFSEVAASLRALTARGSD